MLLSIITINLNNAAGLSKTMSAVATELNSNFEWIVIDGGSTDGSQEIIETYQSQLSYWVSEPDQGIYDAMNKGVKASNGQWIWFMNSGDLPVPGMIHQILKEQLSPFDIVYGQNYSAINGQTGKLIVKDFEWSLLSFMNGCIPHQSTLTKREVLLQHPFKPEYRIAACRIFFIETIVQKGLSYQYFPIPLSICDLSGISTTEKGKLLTELEDYLQSYYGSAVFSDLKTLQKMTALSENRRLFDLLQYSSGKPRLKKWLDGVSGVILKLLSK